MIRFAIVVSLVLLSPVFAASETSPGTSEESASLSYESPLGGALELGYSPITFEKFDWMSGITNGKRGNYFRLAGEWMPFTEQIYGKLGFGLETGIAEIKGVPVSAGFESKAIVVPAQLYVSYRLDLMKNQLVVPFGKLGLSTQWVSERTNAPDGERSAYYQGYSLDWSAGGEICLNAIDKKSAREFDAFMGVNNTYLVFEYLKSRTLIGAKQPDLSHEEYRVSLRFEM